MKKLIGIKRKREKKEKGEKGEKREKPCFFPEKLFKILQDENNKQLIHWDKEGKVVEIENEFKFSKILEENFKHSNYDSFIRQLNLYGFEKLTNLEQSDKELFTLENFTKNSNEEDIREIKRKKKDSNNIKTKQTEEREKIEENNKKIDEFLIEIKKEEDDLIKIEKYKSIINDDKIYINNKLITNILEYINDKKKEIKINNEKYQNEISTSFFTKIRKYFIEMNREKQEKKEKQKSKTNIIRRSYKPKNPIQKDNDFVPPITPIIKKPEIQFNNNEDLKSSFISIQSNASEIKNLLDINN